MHGKTTTVKEQFKYTDDLYYNYLYALSVKLHRAYLHYN